MSVQVQPKHLADAISRVVGAVERSKTMPVLAHIHMSTSGGLLTLRATDLDTEITTSIDCEGTLPPTCAPADRLVSTVARLADRGSAQLSIDDPHLVIASGRSRFTMPILPIDQFPSIKTAEPGSSFVIEGNLLAGLFDTCAVAIDANSDRFYLNGIFMFAGSLTAGGARQLCGVATDGKILVAREVPADMPDDVPSVIIPKKAILMLGKMVGGWDQVALEVTSTLLVVAFGSTRVTTKLIEGHYPDWRRIVPGVSPMVSYDSEVLSASVATAFAAVKSDQKTTGLKLKFEDGETEFSIQNTDGSAAGLDACAHSLMSTPGATVICAHPKHLSDAIAALASDTIQLGFLDGGSPILLTAPGVSDRKAVISPMRTGDA